MTLTPGTHLGPYEIVGQIGAGGMGEVWKAKDTRLGRDVAIKVLPAAFAEEPERLKRFEQEARMVAALSHPNVLAIFDVGTHEGSPYLVSELLKGGTLRERLSGGPLPVAKALDIAIQVARGLAAAHDKGIIHRDLKPENIFLTHDAVKILDFGLAKQAPVIQPGSQSELPTRDFRNATQQGAILGTVGYMSPEQVRGEAVDARSDLFALGVVIYEMLSGRQAFRGRTQADTLSAILREEPPELDAGLKVPPLLERVLRSCLSKEVEGRFHSAHDLAFALQSAMEAGTPSMGAMVQVQASANEQKHWRRLWPWAPWGVWAHRHRTSLVAAALLAVALAVVGALMFGNWKTAAASTGLPSVLALPCTVYGAPEVAFLTDAVPGTISTLLSQVEGLDTKVPPNSFEVEKVKGDLTKLAALYQVSSFIVTSISTSQGRLALNVQLVDAGTRKVKWGKLYEGPREAYNDLARQAAEGIRLAMRPEALPLPASGVSSEAELAFRQGMYYAYRFNNSDHNPDDFETALRNFTRALEINPTYAAAAARIAMLYMWRFDLQGDVHESRKQAESWARRALGIDPRCGLAWAALSLVEVYATHADAERGIDYAVKAVAFAPREASAHASLGQWLSDPGSVSLFLAANLRSVDLDPLLVAPAGNAAAGLSWLGRPGEAIIVLDRALQVEAEFEFGLAARGFALIKLGRLNEAARELQHSEAKSLRMHTTGELWRQIRFALAVAQRDTVMSEALARQVLASVFDPRADANLVGNAMLFATPSLARMGRKDDAIRVLEKAVEVGLPPPYDWLLVEPDFQSLRGDPRFTKVLAASRDGAAMVARILSQSRARGELPKYLEQPLNDLVKLLNQQGPKG